MAEDDAEQPTRHPQFYFKNSTHVFQAGTKLYKLHAELLARRIYLFEGMLSEDIGDDNAEMARPKLRIGVGEGISDEKPIVMDMGMATCDEFDALLDHIYDSENNKQYSLMYLVAVLKLSHQWGCSSGEDFSMRRLKDIEMSVPAALRLRLARVHGIHDWLKPAF
ncbi:hypothetical protein GSI_10120 [Ganoderma sinense ZZ0214-1]|uniref:BTB domain-containing protein n=1 Tax=Ganoderma sinense ZZ0214-1 TaxID=1077348 RepID=A0A2G8RZP2_9APHY|nr:hypothetical protein GSI_10120 [Ganoderma sinense ZZ0214-1]